MSHIIVGNYSVLVIAFRGQIRGLKVEKGGQLDSATPKNSSINEKHRVLIRYQ